MDQNLKLFLLLCVVIFLLYVGILLLVFWVKLVLLLFYQPVLLSLGLLFLAFAAFVFTLFWIPLERPLFKKILWLLVAWNVQQFGQEEFVVIGYTIQGSRWIDNELTYRIRQKLPKESTDEIIQQACGLWANASNLKFTRKETGRVHIDISFVNGDHIKSDGEGGVLGRAYYPAGGGDIYFDDSENWTLNTTYRLLNEKSLLITAIHELGHALGIAHSTKPSALMYAYQGGRTLNWWMVLMLVEVKLDVDDIQAIQTLYGKPGLPRPQYEDVEEIDIVLGNKRRSLYRCRDFSSTLHLDEHYRLVLIGKV